MLLRHRVQSQRSSTYRCTRATADRGNHPIQANLLRTGANRPTTGGNAAAAGFEPVALTSSRARHGARSVEHQPGVARVPVGSKHLEWAGRTCGIQRSLVPSRGLRHSARRQRVVASDPAKRRPSSVRRFERRTAPLTTCRLTPRCSGRYPGVRPGSAAELITR